MDGVRQFAEEIAGKIKGCLPEGHREACEIVETTKINGVPVTGIRFGNPGDETAAVVYMEPYLDNHRAGMTMDEIIADIVGKVEECVAVSTDGRDFRYAKDFLSPALINTAANREMLRHLPHVEIEDLSLICQMLIPLEDGQGTIPVAKEQLRKWGVGKETLFGQAFENMRPSYTLQETETYEKEVIIGIRQDNLLEIPENCTPCDKQRASGTGEGKIFVLSNRTRRYGAAALACPDVMGKVCGLLPEGFYIVPSSIHECLVVQKAKGLTRKHLERWMKETGEKSLVEPQEKLSDHIYEYDREKKSIRLAAKERDKERGMER